MGIFVTGIVTGYFGVEICHGLVGVSRVSFSVFVTGYKKMSRGKKKHWKDDPAPGDKLYADFKNLTVRSTLDW